ncbi:hypothetical protein MAM1_0112d05606 [Mucor ambiguus]|uniref:Uncharacterized protein n=1 Tax=Mucor ambiguus TaxID=91626 RepID=A0A0C9MFT4_9FUNG|nr:hypothetical protein MAM1_0112d05606 [Mucor ambiguus]
MPMKLVIYNVNANGPFCNHVFPRCHCQHKKPGGSKPDKKKKPAAPKKPVDKKKKKKEEEQKKKALALAKEKEDRKRVVPTFWNPRKPSKGVFEQ